MTWRTPVIEEVKMDAEIGSYQEEPDGLEEAPLRAKATNVRRGRRKKKGGSRHRPPLAAACAATVAAAAGLGAGCSSARETDGSIRAERVATVTAAVLTTPNNWLTRSHDVGRAGTTTTETTLTQSNVQLLKGFGKLYDVSVDDNVWAQILYASQISGPAYPSGSHNVFFVVTANNTLYAFDADTGAFYWATGLGNGNPPPTASDLLNGSGKCATGTPNIPGDVGTISTPVIDPATSMMYVVSHTKESGKLIYRLHKIDITKGYDVVSPQEILNSSGTSFDPNGLQNQRPGLALANGNVYVAFGAYCYDDNGNSYEGWVFAYSASALTKVTAVPDMASGTGAGIWQSGQAPAIDGSGNVYVATGNIQTGTFDPTHGNYSESVLKLSSTLGVLGYFAPSDATRLDGNDLDVGVSGPVLFPGSTTKLLQADKVGRVFLLDTTSAQTLQTPLQTLQAVPPTSSNGQCYNQGAPTCHQFSGAVAWNGPAAGHSTVGVNIYTWPESDVIRAYRYTNSQFETTPFATGQSLPPGNGGFMSLSSNGTQAGTGILWVTSPLYPNGGGHGILYALNAENLSVLWSSGFLASDDLLTGAKWNPPIIADGKVFAATFSHVVSVYGLAASAHVTAYFDKRNTQYVLYPDTSSQMQALSCGPGGCWNQTTAATAGSFTPNFPLTSFSDGLGSSTNGHVFNQYAADGVGAVTMSGAPPSSSNEVTLTNYLGVPEAHSSFWDGSTQHVFMARGDDLNDSLNGAAGALVEEYNNGNWWGNSLAKCPYTKFGNGPRYVTAYWDGVEHVIFDCVADGSAQNPYAHELYETYNNGSWWTHVIATTANSGVAPVRKFAGASGGGIEGILGLGAPGSNTLVFTYFPNAQRHWTSTLIPVPTVGNNSNVLVYPDSTGLRYFFVGGDSHIYALSGSVVPTVVIDLSSIPNHDGSLAGGTTNSVSWTSDLAGYFDGTNDHVFFLASDGYVHEFYGGATSSTNTWVEHRIGNGGALLP